MSQALSTAVVESVLRICEGSDCARGVTVAILLRHQEWDQLVNLTVDPKHHLTAESYFQSAVPTELLRKVEGLPLKVDLHAEAVKSFYESEAQCFRTNERLSPYLEGFSHPSFDRRVNRIIRLARKKVSSVLGPLPQSLKGLFGPGATFSDKGSQASLPHKLSSVPSLTRGFECHLDGWSRTLWGRETLRRGGQLEYTHGNRFTSVPKDSKKNRGICVEPSLNIYYQLAVGAVMKRRLRSAGIELGINSRPVGSFPADVLGQKIGDDGQTVHKAKARIASITREYGTIDLSSASDTVSKSLVKLLVPDLWYELLYSLRSGSTLIEGKWVRLEKFSSMGNGYTFELETLIFASLLSAMMEEMGSTPIWGQNLLVYGDDIILPNEFENEARAMLEFFGFTLNTKKTYFEGHFRESCGGDFWNGHDVRPIYLKSIPEEPDELIAYANGLSLLCERHFISDRFRRGLRRARLRVLDAIPSNIRRCRGPKSLGDTVIHDSEEWWITRWNADEQHPEVRVFRPSRYRRVPWDSFSWQVTLCCSLLGTRYHPKGVIPRDAVLSYSIGWSALPG